LIQDLFLGNMDAKVNMPSDKEDIALL